MVDCIFPKRMTHYIHMPSRPYQMVASNSPPLQSWWEVTLHDH